MSDAAMMPPLRTARVNDESLWVRAVLIAVAALFLLLILFLPLVALCVIAASLARAAGWQSCIATG